MTICARNGHLRLRLCLLPSPIAPSLPCPLQLSSLLVSPPTFRGGLSPATRRRSSVESADDGLLFVPTLPDAHGIEFAEFLSVLEPTGVHAASSPPGAGAESRTPQVLDGLGGECALPHVEPGLDAVESERTVTAPSPSGGLGRLVSDALAAADLARPPVRELARAPFADAKALWRAAGAVGGAATGEEASAALEARKLEPPLSPRSASGTRGDHAFSPFEDVDDFGALARDSGESCSTEDPESGDGSAEGRALRHQHSGLRPLRSARRRRMRAREEAMESAEAVEEVGDAKASGAEGAGAPEEEAEVRDMRSPVEAKGLASTSRVAEAAPLEVVRTASHSLERSSSAPPLPPGVVPTASLTAYLSQALPQPQSGLAWPPRPEALPRIRAPRGTASMPSSAASSPKKRSNDARFDGDEETAAFASPKSRRTRSGSWAGSSRNGEELTSATVDGEVTSGARSANGEDMPQSDEGQAHFPSEGSAATESVEAAVERSALMLAGDRGEAVQSQLLPSGTPASLPSRLSSSSVANSSAGRRSRLGRPAVTPSLALGNSGGMDTIGSDGTEMAHRRDAGAGSFANPLHVATGLAPPTSPFSIVVADSVGSSAPASAASSPRALQRSQQPLAPVASRTGAVPEKSATSEIEPRGETQSSLLRGTQSERGPLEALERPLLDSTLSGLPMHEAPVPLALPALRHASSAPPGLVPGSVEGGVSPMSQHSAGSSPRFFAPAHGARAGERESGPPSGAPCAVAGSPFATPQHASALPSSSLPGVSPSQALQHAPTSSQAAAPAPSSSAAPAARPPVPSQPPRPSSSGGTSVFRGVSRHRLTRRWEASLWLGGRQLYLGGFDSQEAAARAYDLAALTCKGPTAPVNFPAESYAAELAEVAGLGRDEIVAHVRRRSAAFSRGRSRYRGVSGHNGRWEARIGSFDGRKNVSFGVFETEEEAARQYDRALISEKGRAAKTNFPMSEYEREAHAAVVAGNAELPRWILALGLGGGGRGRGGGGGMAAGAAMQLGSVGEGGFSGVPTSQGLPSLLPGGAFAVPGTLGAATSASPLRPGQHGFPPSGAGVAFPATPDFSAYTAAGYPHPYVSEAGFPSSLEAANAGTYAMRSLGSLPSSSQSEGDQGATTPTGAQPGTGTAPGGFAGPLLHHAPMPPMTGYASNALQSLPSLRATEGLAPGAAPQASMVVNGHAPLAHWPLHAAVPWQGYLPASEPTSRASSPRHGTGAAVPANGHAASYAHRSTAADAAATTAPWHLSADSSRAAWAVAAAAAGPSALPIAGGAHPGLCWDAAVAAHGPAAVGWPAGSATAAAAAAASGHLASKSDPGDISRGFAASTHLGHAAWVATGGAGTGWNEGEVGSGVAQGERAGSTPRSSRGEDAPGGDAGAHRWAPRHATSTASHGGGASAETSWSSVPTAEASWPPPVWLGVEQSASLAPGGGQGAGWEVPTAAAQAAWPQANARWTGSEGA